MSLPFTTYFCNLPQIKRVSTVCLCFAVDEHVKNIKQDQKMITKTKPSKFFTVSAVVTALVFTTIAVRTFAADADEDAIKKVMKTYHKAPKGVDSVSKKAVEGTASPEEIKKLIAGYKIMAAAKAPKGDDASWKEKTSKLLVASQGLEKGGADARAAYKEAVSCKACHSVHKPD